MISARLRPLRPRALSLLLQATGPLTTGDVARQLGTTLTVARNALDRLEQRGEVVRWWDAGRGASAWRVPRIEAGGVHG